MSRRNRAISARKGSNKFEYDGRGLIPASIEKQGLGPAMVEHGVDIATAVDVSAAIYQRSLGADVYIVGGWRYDPDLKWYGQKGISDIRQLKGKRLGIREREGLVYGFMANLLLQAGIDPEKEVTWVFDPVFGYGNDPKHVECSATERSMPCRRFRHFPNSLRTKDSLF